MTTDLDLTISGSACSINCRASRWTTDNYSFTIETWLKKADLQALRNSIRPGAWKELFRVLGRPRFYDTSWQGLNTLSFTPASNSSSNLKNMRDGTTVGFVKTITTSPLEGSSGFIFTKLEMAISGSAAL